MRLSVLPASIAIAASAFALVLAAHYPLGAGAAIPLVAAWIVASWWRPGAWMVLPAAIPVIGLAPWTGWITFEELDMLVLGCVAGGYARLAWPGNDSRQRMQAPTRVFGASAGSWLLIVAFAVSILIALLRGFNDAGGFSFGWFQGYQEPMNSVRLAKPFLLALMLLPLWQSAWQRDPDHASGTLIRTITAGLALAALCTVWERMAFTGLTNFSSDYRTTGLFWEMHVGGAALDGFLALTAPFALLALARARTRIGAALAVAVLAVATYACLTTFSRGVYLAIPIALIAFMLLTRLQQTGAQSKEWVQSNSPGQEDQYWNRSRRPLFEISVGLALTAGFAVGAFWVFQSAGYRGMAALLGATILMLPLVGRARDLRRSEWLVAGVVGLILSALALAVSLLVAKGPYLMWAFSAVITAVALLLPHDRRKAAHTAGAIGLGGFISLVMCTALVTWHWGGTAGFVAAIAPLLLLVATFAFACVTPMTWWPASQKSQMTIFAMMCVAAATIGVVSGGAFMSSRFSTGEQDLEGRFAHWRLGTDMLLSPAEWILGKGLGRFPANYFLVGEPELHPGDYRLKSEGGNNYLTLTGGLHANGWGEIFRVTQRVGEPGAGATVSARVRTGEAATLHFEICEKQLLYGQHCVVRNIAIKATAGAWQTISAEMRGNTAPTRGNWFAPRLIAFSMAVSSRGGRADIDDVVLTSHDGKPLLSNSNFDGEMAHWFFSSDKYHLPWHMKNLFLHLTFDQGLVGAGLFTLLLATAIWRTALGAARHHILAPALATGLIGFSIVGLFDSLLDVPRLAWLFYVLLLIALFLPRSGSIARRRNSSSRRAVASTLIIMCLAWVMHPVPALANDTAGQPLIQVGPDRQVRTLAEASKLAKDGFTIEVDAGEYLGDVAVWTQNNLTLKAVGGRVVLKARGQAAEGKAIWVIRGGLIDVEGFDFMETQVSGHNGAGIRLENGHLRVRDCRFIDNENGILTSNRADVELDIIDSEFGHNGYGDGQSHNLYVGAIARLSVSGSYFHHAIVGHLLKSRAARNDIRYNRLADEPGGRASYELEFPSGGVAIVVGNIIVQEPKTENPNMVSYGSEGYRWPVNALLLIHNTFIDRRPQGGVFLKVKPGDVRITAINNLLVGNSSLQSAGPGDYRGNATASLDAFASDPHDSYRIRHKARAAATLVDPGEYEGTPLAPQSQFKFPRGTVALKGKGQSPGAVQ